VVARRGARRLVWLSQRHEGAIGEGDVQTGRRSSTTQHAS